MKDFPDAGSRVDPSVTAKGFKHIYRQAAWQVRDAALARQILLRTRDLHEALERLRALFHEGRLSAAGASLQAAFQPLVGLHALGFATGFLTGGWSGAVVGALVAPTGGGGPALRAALSVPAIPLLIAGALHDRRRAIRAQDRLVRSLHTDIDRLADERHALRERFFPGSKTAKPPCRTTLR